MVQYLTKSHMNKIGYFKAEDWEVDYVKSKFPKDELEIYEVSLTADNIGKFPEIKDNDILSIFVQSEVTKELLDELPDLKFIATRSTGFDHIDLEECAKRGIVVSNVPSYGQNTVAEQGMALLLALSRKIFPSVERTKGGNFSDLDGLRGFDLLGKTIGIVGVGKIGQYMVRMAKGFGMNVIASEPRPKPELAQELGFEYAKSLDELLAASDVISLHAPYMESTHHMISKKNIKKVKKGAILINTARGGLVETEAMLAALLDGTLGGAGLDVLEEENLVRNEAELAYKEFAAENLEVALQNHKLASLDNVIITPHNAFNTTEAVNRIVDTSIENIEAYKNGKPINIVKK